jgi:glycosyltransferase involved in cell wall biosynthesis
MRLGILASHPIQYHAPVFRALAGQCDLTVFFAHRQTPQGQAAAGFGVAFDWDVDLLSGYRHVFLRNQAAVPATNRFFGCNCPELDGLIANQFDAFVVTGWALFAYWQAVWACRKRGIPVLIRGDSQLPLQRRAALRVAKEIAYPWLLRSFNGFLYVGQRNREYLLHYGVAPDRLFFAPHCIDNRLFAAGAGDDPKQAPAPPGSQTKQVLFVGKLIERKRPADIIDAVSIARREGTDVEVVFVGDGKLRDRLAEHAARLHVPVRFVGFKNQTELPGYYAAADVIVLPSDSQETWGLVINEAMACGTPAIVSDAVGCGPDLIDTGCTGLVYPLAAVDALASAIREVIAWDRHVVRAALAAKVETYSPDRAAQGIVEGAAQLISRRPRRGNA